MSHEPEPGSLEANMVSAYESRRDGKQETEDELAENRAALLVAERAEVNASLRTQLGFEPESSDGEKPNEGHGARSTGPRLAPQTRDEVNAYLAGEYARSERKIARERITEIGSSPIS